MRIFVIIWSASIKYRGFSALISSNNITLNGFVSIVRRAFSVIIASRQAVSVIITSIIIICFSNFLAGIGFDCIIIGAVIRSGAIIL